MVIVVDDGIATGSTVIAALRMLHDTGAHEVIVAVPVAALAELVRVTRAAVADSPGAELVVFGHLAEGNLHINILGAGDRASHLTEVVLQMAIDLDGTIKLFAAAEAPTVVINTRPSAPTATASGLAGNLVRAVIASVVRLIVSIEVSS